MIANPFSLENKTILVTGASSGLGRAAAVAISKMGAKVIISGRNQERLDETLASLSGDGHMTVIADFLQDNAIAGIIAQIKAPVDGVVHSAGIPLTLPFKFSTPETVRNVMHVNFESPFLLTQQLVKNKLMNNGGSIVFVASIAGVLTGAPGISIYAASKAAINGAVKSMALELAFKKIRVNSVSPGMVKTELMQLNANVSSEDYSKDEKENYPLGYGEPDDVAYAIVYFLSNASKWVTGTTLIMDGGVSVH